MTVKEKIKRVDECLDEIYAAGYVSFFEKMDSVNYFFQENCNADMMDFVLSHDLSGKRCQYLFIDNKNITEIQISGRMKLIHGLFMRCINLVNAQINTSGINVVTDVFNGCTSLKNAGTLDFSSVGYASRTFQQCSALEEVRIVGAIGVTFDLHWSTKLSKDSINSIMRALSETSSRQTLTLSLTAVNAAFETSEGTADGSSSEEWETLASTKTNWTISLA